MPTAQQVRQGDEDQQWELGLESNLLGAQCTSPLRMGKCCFCWLRKAIEISLGKLSLHNLIEKDCAPPVTSSLKRLISRAFEQRLLGNMIFHIAVIFQESL